MWWEEPKAWGLALYQKAKPPYFSKKPHFSFITAHYCWIIGMTIISSVLIYGGGKGETAYINALMFGSGANTQAGLNPVDINLLNTFQQIVIYIFSMLSNPITLHGTVVVLRLYWFEKRFQGWVRDAKNRRTTLTKSRSQARGEESRMEEGVNGRRITIIPRLGRGPRMTNDGILLDSLTKGKTTEKPDDSDESNGTERRSNSIEVDSMGSPNGHDLSHTYTNRHSHLDGSSLQPVPEISLPESASDSRASATSSSKDDVADHPVVHTAITFADTVKRSDGLDDEALHLPQHRANAEHIAILERQRNQDNEVLRIPGPRDAERGMGPRRLEMDDMNDEEDALTRMRTRESRLDHANISSNQNIRERQATITIAEPERRKRDELANDAKAMGKTFESLRLRKPRFFNRGQKKVHEDSDEAPMEQPSRIRTLDTIRNVLSREKTEDMPYLSYNATIGRNSNFIGLSLEQREELGGIEYRSLRTLAMILLIYFWGFQLLGLIFFLPYILHNNRYGQVVNDDGIDRTWWAFFTANSAFMDLGYTLTPDSMISFQTSVYVLIVMWFVIIIGNTGFPVMLRFVIWLASCIVPSGTGLWEELRFLLDHPRRCFTLLFPSGANWWLFWILVVLNAIDLLFFIVLDLNSGPIAHLPVHIRVVDGLFQAASTRTAGFACVNIAELHPAMPVLYLIMMYISVFPIAISIRRTNVYEEKSLGVYHDKDVEDEDGNDASAMSYVGTHLRRQLSFDLWFVFLGLFILAISEGGKIQDGKFNTFDVLFEVVSAYGTVGLSLGIPSSNASLSAQFSTVGKLVIIAMEIRGRHRGLPYGLDRAVLLPSESRFKKEAEEPMPAMRRSSTSGSAAFSSGAQVRGRSVGTGRGRSLSRERERSNSNLITQFLHPGPIVPHDSVYSHRRTMSSETRARPSEQLRRARTHSVIQDEPSMSPTTEANPRRSGTSPML